MTTRATGARNPRIKANLSRPVAPAPALAGTLLTTLLLSTLLLLAARPLQAQSGGKIGPEAPVTYANRFEAYGGLSFMNFQAGQNLPSRMNMGGGELQGTYWLAGDSIWRRHLGVSADYRFEAGTTPVLPSPASINPARKLVRMNIGMAGLQWRGPRNHYAALNYHALAGVGAGDFSPAGDQFGHPYNVGLYDSSIKPMGVAGVSLDYNRSKNIAIRIQPDLVFEHFGTETREFFSLSGGVLYRFGKN
ncbi:MAG TPA: hypothetical protein VNW54_09865 [Granulicella sp.]|nr:hypothetical protein [Granulicella sp.]